MKKTKIATTLAAMVAVALAAIPALAQNERPADDLSTVCAFHDQEGMTYEDMDRWMDSATHNVWMDSSDHGNMMGSGNMMGAGNVTGFSR